MAKTSFATKRNPRNAESELFRRLTRLLSGPITNMRTQTPRALKRKQLDKYKFKSASGKSFKKSIYNPFESIQLNQLTNQNRTARYIDFDQMEYEPIIGSAMDIYADEITTQSSLQPMLKINCTNEEIKSVLHSLYYNILNIEFNLFGWARSLCKYGDFFLYLDVDDAVGVTNVLGIPIHEIERLEGEDPDNPQYVQFQWNSAGMTLENWQMAHFRILGNDKYAPYGTSVLESARRIWRQLHLLEDHMMAYRISRSSERRVFYIDVGNIAPQDVEQYIQKVMTQMKRNQVVDADTGRVDLRYNPMSVEDDYFLPVRGNSQTKIATLPGGQYTGDIDDVTYLKDKLFAALKIPQSYLFRGEGGDEDKTTLAQKDIRFARTIQRLQRSVVTELEKVGLIHLYTLGYRGKDLLGFTLELNNPSKIAELQELEHWKTRFDVSAGATDGYFSRRWVAKNLLGMTDEEFERNQRERFYDAEQDAMLEQVAEAYSEDAEGGGMGDLFGDEGGLGDDDGFDDADLEGVTDELTGDGEDMEAEEGDETLLAAPAKRDDATTTPKSKGKMYHPEKVDKRSIGARARHFKSQWAGEKASNTPRNVHPGLGDLKRLGRGISEGLDPTYKEEQKLLSMNFETKKLIRELEIRETQGKDAKDEKIQAQ